MKPEHFKEFNIEHAKAGAPYCQRNGLAARIGIWDGRSFTTNTCLIGEYEYCEGRFSATSWLANGGNPNGTKSNDLIMLPLGYCEGKPVFVGDELENTLPNSSTFTVYAGVDVTRDNFRWPRTAPVMPTFSVFKQEQELISTNMILRRQEIEAYYKELDEFNGVAK